MVVFKVLSVIVAEPNTIVHSPSPVPGVAPVKAALVLHKCCSLPASIVNELLVTVTSSYKSQPLFVIVQRNVFTPTVKPLTPLILAFGKSDVPPPTTVLHKPVPVVAALAVNVAVKPQTPWSKPAFGVFGKLLITITSSIATQPSSVTVQRKVLVPRLMLIKLGLFTDVLLKSAEPTMVVQRP